MSQMNHLNEGRSEMGRMNHPDGGRSEMRTMHYFMKGGLK